ncbi:MAG: uncharacterized protein QOF82_1499 [Frankiales bacterium]|jgi:predicted CoA-binding protein|nr:uncharacterized protein [Frankiales bacterium]
MTDDVVARLLAYDTWAVVGLGGDPGRPAYGVATFLAQQGKRIVPVHPRAPEVLGQQGYRTLAEIPFPVDVVDVFRRSDQAGRFADQAVAIGAKGVWFQLDIVDDEAYARTVGAGLDMVMNRCPRIEWPENSRHP